jgi:hypothetical protein
MMKLATLILFIFSGSAFSISTKIKSFDLNKDGVKDRFEYYQVEKMIRLEEDRNNDS